MVKAILLEPALRHYYVKFAKRQVGPIKRQSSQYWLLIGHALNQSSSTALQSRVLIHVGPLLRWDGSSGPIRLIGCSSWLNASHSIHLCLTHFKNAHECQTKRDRTQYPVSTKPITNMSFFYCFSNHLKTDLDFYPSQIHTYNNVLPNYYYYLLSSQHNIRFLIFSNSSFWCKNLEFYFSFVPAPPISKYPSKKKQTKMSDFILKIRIIFFFCSNTNIHTHKPPQTHKTQTNNELPW